MNGSKAALIVAAVLGLAGAGLNYFYLSEKARDVEKIAFIGIREGAIIHPGDRLAESHFVPIAIPKANIGDLSHVAVRYSDRATVEGMPAVRLYTGGELLLRSDLRTPPPELALNRENERAMWIPVDTRTFVPSLVNPGDSVSFLVGDVPTPANPDREYNVDGSLVEGSPADDSSETVLPALPAGSRAELIGPFKVLSLGNRLGSAEVHKASGLPQLQENVMTISVTVQGDQLDTNAAKLWNLLRQSGFRQAGVVLHPRSTKSR
jgi:hypothetical protein